MAERPFELVSREVVDAAVVLIFRCGGCGGENRLPIRDEDPLEDRFPLACPCGAEANLYFGVPKVGRALLGSLKKMPVAPEEYHRCPLPLHN